jgi:thiol-disulfide isomerase/thioredoxin
VLAAHDPPPPSAGEDGANAGGEGSAPPADADEGGTAPASESATGGATTDAGATSAGVEPPPTDDGGTPAADTAPALPKPLHGKVVAACGKDDGVGQRLKSFKLKTVDGKPVSQNSWRGRVLLVNFWGTWCKPCLKELPEFEQIYRRYKKHGLTLVAIATDEDPEPVKEYIDARKISAKVVIGAEDYAGQYGSTKFPFSFVVDKKGVIRASYRGYKPECIGKLEADVRKELEARAAP